MAVRKKVWLEGFQDCYKYREDEADVLYSYPAQAKLDALDNAKVLLGKPLLAVQGREHGSHFGKAFSIYKV